ncbi:uncharacterized protein [Eurosta solidaginis]|uniref:uncharacterized protein n=1 Tax=Eurosta solidaginis TaxID=178769 RepID=UPI003530DFB8
MEEQSENNEQSQQTSSTAITRPLNNQSSAAAPAEDDAWWWEVENGDLILDLVPNIEVLQSSESENVNNNNNTVSVDFTIRLKHDDTNATTNTRDCTADTEMIEEDVHTNHASAITTNELHNKDSSTIDLPQNIHTNYNRSTHSSHDSPAPNKVADIGGIAAIGREQSLEEFKEELRIKRLARQTAVQDLRDEIATLRRQLADEQELTRRLRRNNAVELSSSDEIEVEATTNDKPLTAAVAAAYEEGAIGGALYGEPDSDDEDPQSRGRHANIELANAQLALQMANAENLSLRTELGVVQKQVGTLKEVIACCKQMLNVKEEQCSQLKTKLEEIELAFSEREMKIMSSNLRQEYERQLGNIRQLRQLYEERQRIALAEQENLQRLISIKRDELIVEQQKTKNIEEHNQTLMKEIESANNELATLREECNEHKFEKKTLKEEMGAVNTLFSQMVMGFNGENNLDIDRLTMMLEENRGLLNDMATKEVNCTDGATLPKLLFELVEQAAISSCKVFEDNKRSPTPTTTTNDFSASEEEEDSAMQQTTPNRVDNASAAIKQNLVDEEEATASGSISHSEVADTDDNNTYSKIIQLPASVANATNPCGSRKHHRKSASNRIKLPVTTAAVDCNNSYLNVGGATARSSSALKTDEAEVMSKFATTQEIIGNLPKVWKVLMELLSHHKIERVQFEEHGAGEDCYKSIETANGPKTELSVSKTYIKLKDLILEKKSLVKETNRLKTLNCHLEYRLNEQEKRLSAVSLELTKTWHLVGKMQRQHRQLHTQEQILRYQLQQKRRLLSELKDELEYCRRKWAAARAKNDESQEQCNDLRREFALRKLEHASNSAESGYSDSGQASDEEVGIAATKDVASSGIETNIEDGTVSDVSGRAGCVGGVGGAGAACRRKRTKEMFEHTRKIKRMQSTSPGRAGDDTNEIVLRWNSAPPTCGWRHISRGGGAAVGIDLYDDDVEDNSVTGVSGFTGLTDVANGVDLTGAPTSGRGAIPKSATARSSHRSRREANIEGQQLVEAVLDVNAVRGERAERIQRLEEQCKSLIRQVLETSDNREKLEVQLRSFQDEIAPVQHAVPLNDFIKKKRTDRMTRASSVPVTGTLTPREEEYTRKRSERLERLEEESRQLMSRIKRTSDRGHYLRCSLDRLRRGPSREGSFESNTEEESSKAEEKMTKLAGLAMEKCAHVDGEKGEEIGTNSNEEEEVASFTVTINLNAPTLRGETYTVRRSVLEREDTSYENAAKVTAAGATKLTLNENASAACSSLQDCEKTTNGKDAEDDVVKVNINLLTQNEEAYTARRAARLRRLENESRALLNQISRNNERGQRLGNKLDALHEQHGVDPGTEEDLATSTAAPALDSANTTALAESAPDTPVVSIEQRLENIEQISSNRMERLRILEEEGNELLNRLAGTSARGTQMIQRIAEREQNRQTATAKTTSESDDKTSERITASAAARNLDNKNAEGDVEAATVRSLMPTLNNVACSSIVSEELTDRVTVTTIPSQIAAQKRGAIPKQSQIRSSGLVLNAAIRAEAAHRKEVKPVGDANGESLEDMVRRLRETPFPGENTKDDNQIAVADATGADEIEKEENKEEEQTELEEDKVQVGEIHSEDNTID